MAIIHLSFHCLAVSNRYCIVSFGVCLWVWLVSHSHLGCTDNHNRHEGDWAVVSQCTTHGQVSILQMCPYIWPHLTYTEMWRFSVRLVMANVWRISWFPGLWLVNHSNSWLRLVLNWRVGPIVCQSGPCYDIILYLSNIEHWLTGFRSGTGLNIHSLGNAGDSWKFRNSLL